ncbi:recombinase family protein [Bacillaceae bacterium SIJ1]|uniref:recombinase family protein n=1 Tax=Litoribacterium kuwaitense TaxID=1398745 RepID=UPI0013EA9DB7|nr:recombinase family protein [Litoribacterium kuwaitense]NGP44772.1 recombinase family protein [Litoribacterium kuwaitense]
MKVGYIRNLEGEEEQYRRLLEFGCEHIWHDKQGFLEEQVELEKLLERLTAGDVLVITKLYVLAESTRQLIQIAAECMKKEVMLVSLDDQIDTRKTDDFYIFLQKLDEFKHDVLSAKTKEGMKGAKTRGQQGGRPRKPDEKVKQAMAMYDSRQFNLQEITLATGISKTTLYRYLEDRRRDQ